MGHVARVIARLQTLSAAHSGTPRKADPALPFHRMRLQEEVGEFGAHFFFWFNSEVLLWVGLQ